MNRWSRLMMAVKTGIYTGITTYRQGALVPNARDYAWDDYESRLFRYVHFRHLYFNTAYSSLNTYAKTYLKEHDLYTHTRGIYNPFFRLVEGYLANVWGGNIDYHDMGEGAIPLDLPDDRLADPIGQLWRWSNWQVKKAVVVLLGARDGDVPIKVVDDRRRRKVYFEVGDPATVRRVVFDPQGNVKEIEYAYLRADVIDNVETTPYLYREEWIDDLVRTYRDDELYAYPENTTAAGVPVAEWRNPYGFIPVVWVRHRDIGQAFGANAITGGVRHKIDEANDFASKLNDHLRRALNPVYYFPGVDGPDELTFKAGDDRDDVPGLYGPEGSSAQPLVAPVDASAMLNVLMAQIAEIKADLPELALPDIREHGELTAPGVRHGFADGIAKYVEARAGYDDALVRLNMMGISIGAMGGYAGFEAFSSRSYEQGVLEHRVKERPVIGDTLTLKERVDALTATGAPAWMIWKLVGVDEDDITRGMADKMAQERVAAADFGAALASGAINPLLSPPPVSLPLDDTSDDEDIA